MTKPADVETITKPKNCVNDCIHCLEPDGDRQYYGDDFYCAALNLKVASGNGISDYSAMAENCPDFEE